MNHLLYKLFAVSTAASLYYSNAKGLSFFRSLMPGMSGRSGPGISSFHHK